MLDSPSVNERNVLSQIRYQENIATLHTDSKLMPKHRRAWAAWNYYINKNDSNRVKLTYCMNILQSIESKNDYLVTLNDEGSIDKRKIIDNFRYHHPVFDTESVAAQQQYDLINGCNRTFYLGAYWRNGFHEDGVISAMNAYSNFRKRVTND
jgi:predicted NAD/FAD-binding protein